VYTNTAAAFALANLAATSVNAKAAFDYANGVYTNTAASFLYANGVSVNAKAAFDYANGVYVNTKAAFDKANTGSVGAQGPLGPKSISILNPVAGEEYTIMFTNTALTLAELRTVLRGTTPSVNAHFYWGASRDTGTLVFTTGTISSNTTYGQSNVAFDSASITANSFIWVKINSVGGTTVEYHASMRFG
jgi:hypothetical protein